MVRATEVPGSLYTDRIRGAGCNVGYAFVNFITVQDLLLFAKSKLGVKWFVCSLSSLGPLGD
jgi:hypothetical protein